MVFDTLDDTLITVPAADWVATSDVCYPRISDGIVFFGADEYGTENPDTEKERAIFRLESASMRVKTLSGLFPVCIKCRKIRDEEGYWQRFERYLQEHSDAEFRESICDDCSKALYPKYYK